jgi:hypothetical protein
VNKVITSRITEVPPNRPRLRRLTEGRPQHLAQHLYYTLRLPHHQKRRPQRKVLRCRLVKVLLLMDRVMLLCLLLAYTCELRTDQLKTFFLESADYLTGQMTLYPSDLIMINVRSEILI